MHFVLYLKSETLFTFYTHKYTHTNTHNTHTHNTHMLTHIILIDARWEKCLTSSLLPAAIVLTKELSPHWASGTLAPGAWCDKIAHGAAMPPRTHPGSTWGGGSSQYQFSSCANRQACRWKDTAQGPQQPPPLLSQGSLWGIEGLLGISHMVCFSPAPADLWLSLHGLDDGNTSVEQGQR